MSKQLTNEKKSRKLRYARQTEVSYAAIGKFICEFELLCETMRSCFWHALRSNGLTNQFIAHTIVANQTADPLVVLRGGYHCSDSLAA